jgi:hypothetical protein
MKKLWLNWSYYDVPQHTRESFENYILHGYRPGSFLSAVLTNNFVSAVCCADTENKKYLIDIAKWMIHNAPAVCWGSEQAVTNWINDKDGARTSYYEFQEKKRMWQALTEHENG